MTNATNPTRANDLGSKTPSTSSTENDRPHDKSGIEKVVNRQKRPHKKSRNGCLTCKTHRVKCDEKIPICQRCHRLERECIRPQNKKSITKLRPLASDALRPRQDASRPQILLEPSQALFSSAREHRYYALFSEKVAATLSPYFYNSEWSRMILQACATEWTIRQVAIAIAALDLTLTSGFRGQDPGFAKRWRDSRRLPPPGCGDFERVDEVRSKAAMHHRYALEQYDKAVKRMREDVVKGRTQIRILLITCIVTTCFEVMHGNHDAACSQLHTGLLLFQNWRDQQSNAENHPLGFSSPKPLVVDDFLAQTFGRMEVQTMSFHDKRPIECHGTLYREAHKTASAMPKEFHDLETARIYVDLIMRRQMHFIGSIDRSFIKHSFSSPDDKAPRSFASNDEMELLSDAEMTQESVKTCTELVRWSEAFETLYRRLYMPQTTIQEKIAILTMNIAATASRICSSGVLTGLETRYDLSTQDFQRVLGQCKELLEVQQAEQVKHDSRSMSEPSFVFSFELGVITPLSLIVMKCRDPTLRRAALDLLHKYPRREGVWDSVITAALGRWAISLEEEWERMEDPWDGDSQIYIPENKRVRNVAVRYDLMNKKVVMGCLQWDAVKATWVQRMDDYRCETWRLDSYFGCYAED